MSGSNLQSEEDGIRRVSHRTPAMLAAAAALVVALLVALGAVASSAAGCSSCHASQAEALAETGHASLACSVCHTGSSGQFAASVDVAVRMVPASVGGVAMDGPGRTVGSGPCLECHEDVLVDGLRAANGLRVDHVSCAAEAQCSACHSPSAHGTSTRLVRAPVMSACTVCHLERGASVACETCHEGEMAADHVRDPVWVSAHGPDWEIAHGLGEQQSCSVCHGQEDCARCHGPGVPHGQDFGSAHGAHAIESGRDACLTCHKSSSFCDGCHQVDMPHPTGFLQDHSSVATSMEDPACTTCHPITDCRSCHEFHIHPGGTQPPVGRFGEG